MFELGQWTTINAAHERIQMRNYSSAGERDQLNEDTLVGFEFVTSLWGVSTKHMLTMKNLVTHVVPLAT